MLTVMVSPKFLVTLSILTISWENVCKASKNVSLSAEGDNSSQCLETVKLFCEGKNLPVLRWLYYVSESMNDVEIVSFVALTFNQTAATLNAAFMNASLFILESNQVLSTLTVDILLLLRQNITNISCGSASVRDFHVFEPKRIESPHITNVDAIYNENGKLSQVRAQWIQVLPKFCGTRVDYAMGLSVNGSNASTLTLKTNETVCESNLCIAEKDISETGSDYQLFLTATEYPEYPNSSASVLFPIKLKYSSNNSLQTEVNFTDCINTVTCETALELHSPVCKIQFTTNPLYNRLSDPIVAPTNTTVTIPYLSPNTTYYFEFSIMTNGSLVIKKRMAKVTSLSEPNGLGPKEIIIFCLASLYFLSVPINYFIIFVFIKGFKVIIKKPVLLSSLLFPCLLLVLCSIFLASFGIIFSGTYTCTMQQSSHRTLNSLIDTIAVLSCVGLTSLIIIWIIVGYEIHQQHHKFSNPGSKQKTFNQRQLCSKSSEQNHAETYATLEHSLKTSTTAPYEFDQNRSYGMLNSQIVEESTAYNALRAHDVTENDTYDNLLHTLNLNDNEPKNPMLETSHNFLYGTLEVTMESNEEETYDQLRQDEIARSVPCMDDPMYSCIQNEGATLKRN